MSISVCNMHKCAGPSERERFLAQKLLVSTTCALSIRVPSLSYPRKPSKPIWTPGGWIQGRTQSLGSFCLFIACICRSVLGQLGVPLGCMMLFLPTLGAWQRARAWFWHYMCQCPARCSRLLCSDEKSSLFGKQAVHPEAVSICQIMPFQDREVQ